MEILDHNTHDDIEAVSIIVAGSRGFNDYELLKKTLDSILISGKLCRIVSGTAQGADQLGERYAIERKQLIKRFPADWEKYGKRAGYIRNKEMGEYADAAIVFWDGKSRGTKMMIDIMKELGKPCKVVLY